MKVAENIVHILKATKYLQAHLTDKGQLLADQLMLNGTRFSAEIARHWWKTRFTGIPTEIHLPEPQLTTNLNERLHFLQEPHFLKQLSTLQKEPQKLPAVIKFAQNANNQTQLVCLHVCTPSSAMEQYYKLQRERKIWWMRVSSNPSRYYIEPYELNKEHCQSISLKSKFTFNNDMLVEHSTFVPLHKLSLLHESQEYKIRDESTNKEITSTVIRTVMDLTTATYALLLDACDHNRQDTLMLHRKLVPFQCTILAKSKSNSTVELETFNNLFKHLNREMSEAGLRCYTEGDFMIRSNEQLVEQLNKTDTLGIPYVLLVDEGTLRTGLLQLRSRDTTLSEIIHISDICIYLPNICTH